MFVFIKIITKFVIQLPIIHTELVLMITQINGK